MNHTMKFVRLLSLMGGVLFGLSSCHDTSYFNKEAYTELIKNAFPVENVDSEQEWKTIGSAQLKIQVKMKEDGDYKVYVYSSMPQAGQKNELLAQGTVTNGGTLTTSINYRLNSNCIYIALIDARGFMSVYPRNIEGNELNTSVGDIAVSQTRSLNKRAISSSFSFAQAPSDDQFKSSIPADAVPTSSYNGNYNGNYYLAEGTTYINIWSGCQALYVGPGTFNISGNNYIGGNTTVYLLPGAILNFTGSKGFNNNQYNVKIFISEGAQLNTGLFAIGIACYNRGSMHVNQMRNYDNSIMFNEGTITVDNGLSVENNNAQIVNAGTITAKTLTTAGSGHFLNLGETTIADNTIINSNNCTWQNDGTYTTKYFNYTAGSTNVINNCRLTVTEDFNINLGKTNVNSFQVDANGSVVTKNLNLGIGYIKLGAQALFKVTEKATLNCTTSGYGIYGVGNLHAVFAANHVEEGRSSKAMHVTYEGNLWVAYNTHFPQGHDGDPSHLKYFTGENVIMAIGMDDANISIPSSDCTPGYNQAETPVTPPEADSFTTRFCFEDNFPEPGDYDFNDFVASISIKDKESNKLTLQVTVEAVGASKQLAAALRLKGVPSSGVSITQTSDRWFDIANREPTSEKMLIANSILLPDNMVKTAEKDAVIYICNDAHWTLKQERASVGGVKRAFYNTLAKDQSNTSAVSAEQADPVTCEIELTFDSEESCNAFNAEQLDLFLIEGYNGSYWEVHTYPFKTDCILYNYDHGSYVDDYLDVYPWAIAMPSDFRYPREFHPIGSLKQGVMGGAYQTPGHSFGEWAADRTVATDWYLYPQEGWIY